MAASSRTIDFTSTSLPGHTGATTPSGFSGSMGPEATVVAILTAGNIVVTATQVASTTGLAVVDGTTLTWRQQGITLSNGEVVSLGFNGLEDSTTTAFYEAITIGGSGSSTMPTSQTVVITKSSTTVTSTKAPTHTAGGSPTIGKSSGTASAASTSSSGIAPTMGAGKALALLGAVGGMVAFGL